MSEWIKLHAAVFSHPKTLRMAKCLGLPPAAVAGHLGSLWCWALEYAPAGDLSAFDTEEIEIGAGWQGDDGVFAAAAIAAGYLDELGAGVAIHDWGDYGGKWKEQRLVEAGRSRSRRAAYADGTIDAVRARDGDQCRYCGKVVNWTDKRGPDGGTYDHVMPDGPTDAENLVVACRGCNVSKGHRSPAAAEMSLREVGLGAEPSPYQCESVPNQCESEHRLGRREEKRREESRGELETLWPAAPAVSDATLIDEFEMWWASYGKVGDHAPARDCYLWWRRDRRGRGPRASAEELAIAADRYLEDCARNDRKIKHGATFLAKETKTKSAVWREWAAGEEHGCMDPTAGADVNAVIGFYLGGDNDGRALPASTAGGEDARGGVPARELDEGE